MNTLNPLLDTDSYKASHYLQYPPNTTSMFSYVESRGGKYPVTVFFGLQYILKEYLSVRITPEMVEEAKEFFALHGEPFNYDGWMYVAKKLKGKLPVRIRAVKEGSVIPTHQMLMSIESTDPKAFWVVSYLETMLLRVWYPITVATQSYTIKGLIKAALERTADDPAAELPFKLHDFGSRGVSSRESAGIGGASHLVNFMGSDTVMGVAFANKYYNSKMAGFSIPASEHSSITSWGQENEVEAYRNMLRQFAKPGSLVACVSDSYDLENAVKNLWGTKLRDEVIASGATLVVRPDSGDPATMVFRCCEWLGETYGWVINSVGYKVLNTVRVIQGDGINYDSIAEILHALESNGWSASNVAFGMGGALLQQVNRDTQKFAMKCSSITADGKEIDVYKNPVTDPGKASKKGRLDTVFDGNKFKTIRMSDGAIESAHSVMETVYENGELLVDDSFDEIRKRASQ